MMSDISHWFARRRGIAVAIASCGNYLAGTLWPPIVQYFIAGDGWRATHIVIGVLCLAAMLPLILRAAPSDATTRERARSNRRRRLARSACRRTP